jgi:hypothetical protein
VASREEKEDATMYRTVFPGLIITALCLALAAPVFAARVMHGAIDICEAIDGGAVEPITISGSGRVGEECCARERVSDNEAVLGRFYCVICDPPGSDNCVQEYASKAPGDQFATILLDRALTQQRTIRKALDDLPAKIKELCTPPPTNR